MSYNFKKSQKKPHSLWNINKPCNKEYRKNFESMFQFSPFYRAFTTWTTCSLYPIICK